MSELRKIELESQIFDKENINKTDVELVSLSLENQDFFSFLVNRYKDKLFSYINRLTNVSADEAEDILQDIFIKIYLNLRDFDKDLKFSSWAYRIAHNQVISNYRKIKARPEGYAIDIEDDALRNLASNVNIALDTDLILMKEKVSEVLNSLGEKYREVLVLKFLEEKNYQEISDIIKKPLGTVASMINKAKKDFKKEIDKKEIKF